MNKAQRDKIVKQAEYFVKHESTIRDTAKVFNICKSTIHINLSKRLEHIDYDLYCEVRRLLDKNYREKHIRGGLSTKLKFNK